jgi:hypothetical protein
MKDAERAAEDPLIRLERENKKLQSEKLRLEMENEYLARELVNSKIEMRKDIDLVITFRQIVLPGFYYFGKRSLDRISVDRNCVFSLDQKF